MYLLNEFARTVGAKDKTSRKKKLLKVAGAIATTGLLGAVAYKNKDKLGKLFKKNTKTTKPVRSKIGNTELVNKRKQAIKAEMGDYQYLTKEGNKEAIKAAVSKLKKENKYFKNNEIVLFNNEL